MFIRYCEEIQKYLPSSVYDDTESLLVLTERAERKHIVPVLGDGLYAYLQSAMPFALDEQVPVDGDCVPNDTDSIEMLKKVIGLCQSATAFFTVADNAGQMSLSFNMGNGLAQVNTDGYTAASEESMKRFLSDVWHQAKQDIDDLCTLLEQIAQASPQEEQASTVTGYAYANVLLKITELWKQSEWYYFQGDLLLTTARETKKYVMQSEHPFFYKEYVEMLGELRARQEANVIPELGDELTDALIKSQYTSNVFVNDAATTASGKAVIEKVLKNLRLSLMSYVRHSRTNKAQYENDAHLFMGRAIETIQKHEDVFRPYVEQSPIYIPTDAEVEEGAERKEHVSIVYGTREDSIFNPFG